MYEDLLSRTRFSSMSFQFITHVNNSLILPEDKLLVIYMYKKNRSNNRRGSRRISILLELTD